MVICTPHIEQYQRDVQQAIQEMSGNLPVRCEEDAFTTFLQKYGVDKNTMNKLNNEGCGNVEGLKNLEDADVEEMGLSKFQAKFLKKALADLRGEQGTTGETATEAVTVERSALNVTGAEDGARVMIAEGGAAKTAGGRIDVKDSPVTAKDVRGNVNIGAVLK